MKPENRKLLETFLRQSNAAADVNGCIDTFNIYIDELLRWNNVVNLTAIEEESEVVIKHFIDSLTPLRFIRDRDFILDIGSGAGFPGLPIKIARPSVRLVMLDARFKKINFLNRVIHLLELSGTTALHQRAEQKHFQNIMGASFDVVISRASFSLPELFDLSLPYLKKGGRLIAMKARETEAYDAAAGLKQADELITSLPDGSFRRILVFKKV